MTIKKLKELVASGQFHCALHRGPHLWIYKKSRLPGGNVAGIFHNSLPEYEEARLVLKEAKERT